MGTPRATAPGERGVIGCIDPHGSWAEDLTAWATGRRLDLICQDGPFRLWRRPPWQGCVLTSVDACGCFAGTSFPPSQDPPGPALRTWRDHGVAALSELCGQFALTLWDRRLHELILYRDASGSHNLYYHQPPTGGLVFADDLDLLVTSPAVDKRLSRPSLHEYLRLLDVSTPNTIYAGSSPPNRGRPASTEPTAFTRARSARAPAKTPDIPLGPWLPRRRPWTSTSTRQWRPVWTATEPPSPSSAVVSIRQCSAPWPRPMPGVG